jgi:hypothetical protein
MNFITNSEEHFQTIAGVHSVNTRHEHCLHKPAAKVLKSLMNEKALFKIALKQYLNTHSFYFVHEYLLNKKWLIYLKTVWIA